MKSVAFSYRNKIFRPMRSGVAVGYELAVDM